MEEIQTKAELPEKVYMCYTSKYAYDAGVFYVSTK